MYSGLKTQTETDVLFKHYLERNYFNLFRRYDSNKFIELYITIFIQGGLNSY